MMAWGNNAQEIQNAVNLANLQSYDFGDIPDEKRVIATSHINEELEEVFWFSRYTAIHPCHALELTLLLHITDNSNEPKMLERFKAS